MVEKLGYGTEFGVDIDGNVSVNMGNLMKFRFHEANQFLAISR